MINGLLAKANDIDETLFDVSGPTYYFPLSEYCEIDPVLKDYAGAFEGINLTMNVLEWPKNNPVMEDLKLLGGRRTPLNFIKVLGDDEIILLNENDTVKQKLFSSNQICHVVLGFYDKTRKVSKQLLEKMVKVKFLDGESTYTKQELAILEDWFKAQGAQRMQNLYQQHILAGHPDKIAAYSQSNLFTLFQRLLH